MDFALDIVIGLLEIIPGNKWVKTILFIIVTQLVTVFATLVAIASTIQSPNIVVDILFWIILFLWCMFTFVLAIQGHKRNWK